MKSLLDSSISVWGSTHAMCCSGYPVRTKIAFCLLIYMMIVVYLHLFSHLLHLITFYLIWFIFYFLLCWIGFLRLEDLIRWFFLFKITTLSSRSLLYLFKYVEQLIYSNHLDYPIFLNFLFSIEKLGRYTQIQKFIRKNNLQF